MRDSTIMHHERSCCTCFRTYPLHYFNHYSPVIPLNSLNYANQSEFLGCCVANSKGIREQYLSLYRITNYKKLTFTWTRVLMSDTGTCSSVGYV